VPLCWIRKSRFPISVFWNSKLNRIAWCVKKQNFRCFAVSSQKTHKYLPAELKIPRNTSILSNRIQFQKWAFQRWLGQYFESSSKSGRKNLAISSSQDQKWAKTAWSFLWVNLTQLPKIRYRVRELKPKKFEMWCCLGVYWKSSKVVSFRLERMKRFESERSILFVTLRLKRACAALSTPR